MQSGVEEHGSHVSGGLAKLSHAYVARVARLSASHEKCRGVHVNAGLFDSRIAEYSRVISPSFADTPGHRV
jgi:hypothetical protein